MAWTKADIERMLARGDWTTLTELLRTMPTANPGLEGQPVILYGHSATVDSYNTPGTTKWFQRVQRRLGLGPVLSRATGGFDGLQMLERMMGTTKPYYAWVPGTKAIVVVMAGGNESIQGTGNPGQLQMIQDTIYSQLAWLSLDNFTHINDMTRVGTWTEVTSYTGVPRGSYRYSVTAGETASASVTGTAVAVFFSTWDGVAVQGRDIEILVDGVLRATIDTETAATTAEWGDTLLGGGIGAYVVRGLSAGAHTVVARAGTGLGGGAGTPAATGVLGVGAVSATPPLIVMFADAKAGPYATEAEYQAVYGAIRTAVTNFNGTHVRLIEANVDMPISGITGADGVHGNDAWEAIMADKLEETLRAEAYLPYYPNPGSVLPGMGEPIATYSYPGAVAVNTGTLLYPVTKSFIYLGAWAYIGTPPTGTPLIVDVKRNNTSVYAADTTKRPTIPVGTSAAQYPHVPIQMLSGSPYPMLFDSGDYMTVDVTQVGSTVAGSNLTVVIEGIYRDNA